MISEGSHEGDEKTKESRMGGGWGTRMSRASS